ncbi:hypothetical protein ILUMI_06477, partial [Ignelater luminosus]
MQIANVALKANNGKDDNVEASAMPSLSDTGGISNISPCPDAFPIIPDLDLLLVDPKNSEVREIALDKFLKSLSIGVANSNSEIIDKDEDSDDSIKDKDYHYEPGETSDSDGDVLSEPDENEGKEEDDEINTNPSAELSKGRPKKKRKSKYKDQDRHIRKRIRSSNKPHYPYKGK